MPDGHQVEALRAALRWRPGRMPSLLAHRGAPAAGWPENSLATYSEAMAQAPCWVEVDIRTTRDGHFVLNHDARLDRSTTGSGPLADRTLAELRRFALRALDGTPTAHPIEELGRVLDWARGRTVVFLDIKEGRPAFSPVLRFIRDRAAVPFCVVLTYEIGDTVAVHQIAPDIAVYGRATNEAFVAELLAAGIPLDRLVAWIHDETPPGVFQRLHDAGLLTTYGTFLEVDRLARKQGLGLYAERLAKGADILNTDDVPQAAAAIRRFAGATRRQA